MAASITRLRPSRSDTAPANGAATATPRAVALTVQAAPVAETPRSAASSGSSGCVE
jgi:hypothetical protein